MNASNSHASLNSKANWSPHPRLLATQVPVVQKQIDRAPDLHFEEPLNGEQYFWIHEAKERLQDFAFSKGFAVAITSGGEKKGRVRISCVHHGKPRDTRHLDMPATDPVAEQAVPCNNPESSTVCY
jgi:hypothetical protein